MFEFLGYAKREVIVTHRVLGNLKKLPDDYKLFLENLKVFGPELCSPRHGISRELIFTTEDILQIKEYIQQILSVTGRVHSLAKRILEEAGFEVYCDLAQREDLNDWVKNHHFYVRGIHNLQEFLYKNCLENSTCYNSLLCDETHLFTGETERQLQIASKRPPSCRIEEIDDRSKLPFKGPIGRYIHEQYQHQDRPPSYLRCCIFCKDKREIIQNIETGKREVVTHQPHSIFGILGVKSRKITQEPITIDRVTSVNWKPFPLNQITTTKKPVPAYLLQFLLPKIVLDPQKRIGYPWVNVVASKELVEEITAFLMEFPNLYMDLVRLFLPAKKFPNINNFILNSPNFYASKGIVIDNYTCMRRAIVDR